MEKATVDLLISISSILIPIVISVGGFLVAYGQMKEKMLTKEQFKLFCDANQLTCSKAVSAKIDNVADDVKDLKGLVIDLHDKQTEKMEKMDQKREDSKDSTSDEIKKLSIVIGRVEGHLSAIANKASG